MPRKITDITNPQKPSQVPKVVVYVLIRRLLAEWVVKGETFRRLSVAEIPRESHSIRVILPKKFIPSKLPPAEIGGCHFRAPQSEQWLLERAACQVPRLVRIYGNR